MWSTEMGDKEIACISTMGMQVPFSSLSLGTAEDLMKYFHRTNQSLTQRAKVTHRKNTETNKYREWLLWKRQMISPGSDRKWKEGSGDSQTSRVSAVFAIYNFRWMISDMFFYILCMQQMHTAHWHEMHKYQCMCHISQFPWWGLWMFCPSSCSLRWHQKWPRWISIQFTIVSLPRQSVLRTSLSRSHLWTLTCWIFDLLWDNMVLGLKDSSKWNLYVPTSQGFAVTQLLPVN